ncbi:MAG: endopeptidase La [Parcubacteria group bacterium GW2011_GWA2_38_13b]|nr:MAG: endopeptidase La [Parcubacteria group bacterium GW2011_GWA2_38_13b]
MEKIYYMVLDSSFIIFPSETNYILHLPETIAQYVQCSKLKKIALFFIHPPKYKTSSGFGILCEIIKIDVEKTKNNVTKFHLKPTHRIKTQINYLQQATGFIENYEIVENSAQDCSKDAVELCISEIIQQINDGIKSDNGKIAAVYNIFLNQKHPDTHLTKEDVNLIIDMLTTTESSELFREMSNYFCGDPNRLSALIDYLFNQIFTEKIAKAKFHALNEPKVIKRFEIFVENFVPIFCEFINSQHSDASQSDADKKESQEMEEKIKDPKIPEEVRKIIKNETKKLNRMNSSSSEYEVSRAYLDWLMAIPWGIYTEDNLNIENLKQCLNDDHLGLERVKNRIIEYMAAQNLNPSRKAPILCFVGPPGTGKTSIANSVAKAMGRKKINISLGSLRDEAELKGHRRTYIGALPGKIIDGLKRTGSSNPVIILDEVDKLCKDMRGDPAAALLEILDPEQNHSFRDHYLDVPVDLSKVLFITTANVLDTIPPALLNRQEVIEFSSYLDFEKLEIAKKYLIPRRIKENGLEKFNISFTDQALLNIIRFYLREPGIRKLERKIDQICRKITTKIVEEKLNSIKDNVIDCRHIPTYLGIQKFSSVELIDMEPGVINGLAYMETGYGSILHIEAIKTKNYDKKYKFTGSIGPVMEESLEVIISYLYNNKKKLKLKEDDFEKENGIHVHVPEAAMPKEGPSAGITICAAIYSCLTNKKIRKDIAFTGEITLMGRILPIGRLREKTLGAKRAGITTIILPEGNKKDIEELEAYIKEGINFIFVSNMLEVLIKYHDVIFETNNQKDGK